MKRKSGLQKKISSIFKDIPIDELGSDAPLTATEEQTAQAAQPESNELATNPQQDSIVDPPSISIDLAPQAPAPNQPEPQDNTNVETNSIEVNPDAEVAEPLAIEMDMLEHHQEDSSEQDEIQNLADDGLSYFSFDSEQSTEENVDDIDEFTNTSEANISTDDGNPPTQENAQDLAATTLLEPYNPKKEVDKRQVTMVAMICVLAVGFVFALLRAFAPSIFQEETATPVEDVEITALSITQTVSPQSVWPKPQTYPQVIRDPMSSVMAPTVKDDTVADNNTNMNIKGIVYSQDNPSVIIDEGIYFTGDQVNGVTIVSITQKEVVFEMNGKQWTQVY